MEIMVQQPSRDAARGAFDLSKWMPQADSLAEVYRTASPFPSIVLDNFMAPDVALRAAREFPGPDSGQWLEYRHFNTKKLGQNKMDLLPPLHREIIETFNGDSFVAFLRHLTGISDLVADPHLEGGGLHQILRGGFLNIHADFTAHSCEKHWARRVNLLIYLNEDWKDEYGGHLELWDRNMEACRSRILPILNRCVIFNTDFDTFHGHPEPLTCPETMSRKSIALYYFTPEAKKPKARSTEYRPRPQDGRGKSALIVADKMLLRAYDFGRRRLGLSDRFVSKVLRWFR